MIHCQRFGYYTSKCRALSIRVDEKVNYVEETNKEDDTLLLACNDTHVGQENIWYLDTSASNHMSKNKNIFMELNKSIKSNVEFEDD